MTAVIVALITVIGGIIVALIQQLRKENADQHAEGRKLLGDVRDDVRDVKGDVREVKSEVRDLKGRVSNLERDPTA